MPADRVGTYRIADRLGAGGMGVVYRAYDERLDRWVAIKLIPPGKEGDPQRRARFRREARASAQLCHPAVVQIYDYLETGEGDAIVMELVEGRSLAECLRSGPLSLPQGLGLAQEIGQALAEAHARGIVHRDLKAENVLVTPENHAKVLDFGIAKRLDEDDGSLTSTGVVFGTLRAMSPEQIEGEEVGPQSDLFSFGLLLYEIFTGRSPFLAASPNATMKRVCSHRQTPAHEVNSDVPEALSRLIDRLLEKEPPLRPGSAREVVLALERIAGQLPRLGTQTLEYAGQTLVDDPRRTQATGPTALQHPFPAGRPMSTSAERRQVTVLHCRLGQPGGEPLDPEELLESLSEMHTVVARAVRRFGGHLDPLRGHGWIAYFGDLQAHEDDALRAVYAGLEITDCQRRRPPEPGRRQPAVRIGIHTGPMVVTRGAEAGDDVALGETPSVAAHVQNLAGPGTVVVSQATWRLVEGAVEGKALGPLPGSASEQPLHAYEVAGGTRTSRRTQMFQASTSLVGREQELGLLLERWAAAREGTGQVALILGEAGIGKSRVVWELRQRIAAERSLCLVGHGSPYHLDSALQPLREWLEQLIGTAGEEEQAVRSAHLESTLADLGLPADELAPLLAPLLSLQAEGLQPPAISPEMQRRKTLEALVRLLLAGAERQPLLLIVEDLHWIDPSTLELLGRLVEHLATASILLVLTFRPEGMPAWQDRSYFMRLTLGPLTRAQAGLMVDRLCGGTKLDPELRRQIAIRTDGLPLFVEELSKMILEEVSTGSGRRRPWSGSGPAPEIPETLAGWFMARLDRLGTAREVAQLASVLGREFSADLLHAVSPWSPDDLQRGLDRLTEAEILYRRGLPPRHGYFFKHALLQDAVYASLLRSSRQRLHRQIAEALEERFPGLAEAQPEVLAHHHAQAGSAERAVSLWHRAGERAIQTAANREAANHLDRALELLAALPEGPERDRQELSIQISLGVAEGQIHSYNAPRVQQAYARAWELCSRMPHAPQLFPVLRGLYIFSIMGADTRRAGEICEQLLALAGAGDDPVLFLTSHMGMGFVEMCSGHLSLARSHLEEALQVYGPGRSFHDAALPGTGDPAVECLFVLSWTLWLLGYPDQARARGEECMALARRSAYPQTLVVGMQGSGDLFALLREPGYVRRMGEELLLLAAERGIGLAFPMGELLKGWGMAGQGEGPEGVALMRHSVEARLVMGTRFCMPFNLALLAEVHLRLGQVEEGLSAIASALSIAEDFGPVMNAELYRLRGELLRRRGASDREVEELFEQALDLARGQAALSLELRAAMSLSRLRAAQGRTAEARDLLCAVVSRFTEGFGSWDLLEARALLDELGQGGGVEGRG